MIKVKLDAQEMISVAALAIGDSETTNFVLALSSVNESTGRDRLSIAVSGSKKSIINGIVLAMRNDPDTAALIRKAADIWTIGEARAKSQCDCPTCREERTK